MCIYLISAAQSAVKRGRQEKRENGIRNPESGIGTGIETGT